MAPSTIRRAMRPITRVTEPVIESQTAFRFVVGGDSRPTLPNCGFPRVTHRMFAELRALRPAFVLYTGDFMWGYGAGRQEMLNEIDRFRALADTTGVPLYNAPGNHEMQSDPAAIELLREKGHDLYGSFSVGPWHFIGLNTDEFCLEGRIHGEQLEWLRGDLAAHRDADGIFIFMHRPMYSWFQGDFNPDDQELLRELFAEHPVKAVFAAHDHFHHVEERDGVRYMTVAGAGSPMYAQPAQGGFAHYVLVDVGPDGVEFNVVETGRLDIEHVAGNDGIEPLSIARLANGTDRDLAVGNLEFRVPRLESPDRYRISVDYLDWERNAQAVPTRLRSVTDLGDGSVLLSVSVDVPTGTAFRVVVEARV
jgi:3',5'-cyclic AMP phosphodiesterase CpdA